MSRLHGDLEREHIRTVWNGVTGFQKTIILQGKFGAAMMTPNAGVTVA